MRHQPRCASEPGFSLVELMVTLAIAGLLLAVAAPSLQRFITTRAVVAQADELGGALRLARSEAMKRGMAVSVCASSTTADAEPTCANDADWQTGWLVFSDAGLDGGPSDGDRIIKVQSPAPSVKTLTGPDGVVSFHQNGISASGEEPSFTLLPKLDAADAGYDLAVRRVVVNKQGRVQILVGEGQ